MEFTLRASRRTKRVRLLVRPGGAIVVSGPRWLSMNRARRLLQEHTTWISAATARMRTVHSRHLAGSPAEYERLKDQAQAFIEARLRVLNRSYGCTWQRVTVRNQRTRWGSCSRGGHLSFHYRLLMLPLPLADYVLAHELSHLIEMNHSKAFWNCVARTVPEYRSCRAALRQLSYGDYAE